MYISTVKYENLDVFALLDGTIIKKRILYFPRLKNLLKMFSFYNTLGVVVQIDQETMPELFPEAEAAVALLKNYNPTPVALEPCATGKAAVLSLIVRLPSGGNQRSPAGQTGLAIASALVSLGSVEQKYKENENKVVVNSSTKCQSPTAASGV